jgi:hypothetical protein
MTYDIAAIRLKLRQWRLWANSQPWPIDRGGWGGDLIDPWEWPGLEDIVIEVACDPVAFSRLSPQAQEYVAEQIAEALEDPAVVFQRHLDELLQEISP